MALRCVMFLGSTRSARVGPKVSSFVAKRMEDRGMKVDILDPVTLEDGFFMRLMEKPLFHYKAGQEIPDALVRTGERIKLADAFVVVSPEMNHSLPPGLTNLMSHFGSSYYSFKPSGICVYSAGMWGGARAGVALRPFLAELGCSSVSATLQIAKAQAQLGESAGPEALEMVTTKMCDRMLDQLEWHAHALKTHREMHGVPSESYFQQVRKRGERD
eukprot:TRINITY_DN42900_c0_g1_i1.p1 TRINITY_DN42900_c0_g1~~TRINITY_DN42900_c0_g1_i1.p1  ORF type:complete len:216 (-),score=29.24 TRINITY_DN42900_c0_g1_i1:85-732(-)